MIAIYAYRNYTNNTSALSANLEKLSSGYKINRAGDDAAGLAISEKMRAQITGLGKAQDNAKDGISLVQTAEGTLTEVHDMLNRMYELAEQSANGTYDGTDRTQLQKEVSQLRTEIDRIADSATSTVSSCWTAPCPLIPLCLQPLLLVLTSGSRLALLALQMRQLVLRWERQKSSLLQAPASLLPW